MENINKKVIVSHFVTYQGWYFLCEGTLVDETESLFKIERKWILGIKIHKWYRKGGNYSYKYEVSQNQ